MQGLVQLFNIPQLTAINLKEDEDELQRVMEIYKQEIIILSSMEDGQIQEKIREIKDIDENSSEFTLFKENLFYLKNTYFLEQKEQEEEKINIEVIKKLNFEDVVDITNITDKDVIEISIQQLNEVAKKKLQEEEQWNEYNIVSTMSNKFKIPEQNISFISTLSEYISFVANLNPAEDYVSRGQKDCTFELLPSLHRAHESDFSIHLAAYEGAFKQKIIFYDKDIIIRSDEALRAEGQHFGLPTDYLDFTEAHLISLLFAIEEYDYGNQHSIVYFINSSDYNEESVGQKEKLLDYSSQEIVGTIRSKYSGSRSHFIKLGNSNERIHFQKGCFLKVSTEDKETSNERLKKYCKVAVINKNNKKEILKELFNLGVTFENIYPDKDNVVKSIKFQYKEIIRGQRK